jgi:hypothetical protein
MALYYYPGTRSHGVILSSYLLTWHYIILVLAHMALYYPRTCSHGIILLSWYSLTWRYIILVPAHMALYYYSGTRSHGVILEPALLASLYPHSWRYPRTCSTAIYTRSLGVIFGTRSYASSTCSTAYPLSWRGVHSYASSTCSTAIYTRSLGVICGSRSYASRTRSWRSYTNGTHYDWRSYTTGTNADGWRLAPFRTFLSNLS